MFSRCTSSIAHALRDGSLTSGILGQYQDELEVIHPFPPSEVPNFLYKADPKKLNSAAAMVTSDATLGLMDAGAFLNGQFRSAEPRHSFSQRLNPASLSQCAVPYFPLFRRGCDVILAFDASADSQSLWFDRVAEYATRHNIKTWPQIKYNGPFPSDAPASVGSNQDNPLQEADAQQAERADGDGVPIPADNTAEKALGPFNCWLGDSRAEISAQRLDQPTEEAVMQRDGLALVYYPLSPGEGLPHPSEVWSTWKSVSNDG